MSYADLSTEELVRRCAEAGNDAAWEEFVRRYDRLIAAVIARICRQCGDYIYRVRDDLVQDTYAKLCANDCRILREFDHQHPEAFKGMLKVMAKHLALDYFRSIAPRPKDVSLEDVEEFVGDRNATGPAQIERAVLLQQIEKWLTGICASPPTGERDRTIFFLYYRQGLSAEAIASMAIFNLTTKGVESTLHRLAKALREQIVEQMDSREQPPKGIRLLNTLKKGEGQS
ncbi:MAG TPA: sigma-70 family RNA polymerase sigma factor [Candidatus Saccharimonadales bacterium]|jgi:RNA polymerase sigma-70 factor (ECF subfamily)|nr:sigma-70 family RNA polymerase sigma factor [Candidatus Saccharimonadales bacterium]